MKQRSNQYLVKVLFCSIGYIRYTDDDIWYWGGVGWSWVVRDTRVGLFSCPVVLRTTLDHPQLPSTIYRRKYTLYILTKQNSTSRLDRCFITLYISFHRKQYSFAENWYQDPCGICIFP